MTTQDTNKEGKELVLIDTAKPSFIANGKTYFIETSMSIERYCEFQILEKELTYGMSFEKMMDYLKQIYKMLDKQQFAASAVMIDQMIRGVAKVQEREPVVLKICALFINEENEDRSKWSNDLIVRKIEDWKLEGISMNSFFSLALNSVNGFLDVYNKVSQIASGKELGASIVEQL